MCVIYTEPFDARIDELHTHTHSLTHTHTHTHTHTPLTPSQKLEQLLPAKPDEPIVGDDAEEVHLLDLADTKGMDAMDEEDSDEGEMAGGPRVGCAHQ